MDNHNTARKDSRSWSELKQWEKVAGILSIVAIVAFGAYYITTHQSHGGSCPVSAYNGNSSPTAQDCYEADHSN